MVHTFEGDHGAAAKIYFSSDGKTIIGFNNYKLKLWDIRTGQLLQTIGQFLPQYDAYRSHNVCVSSNGNLAIGLGSEGTVLIWDLFTGQLLRSFEKLVDSEKKFDSDIKAISPDGNLAVSVFDDKTIKLWDLQTGRLLRSVEGSINYFKGLKYLGSLISMSLDGKKAIISRSGDPVLRLWDLQKGQLVYSFEGHKSDITSVAISWDGRVAISGSKDRTLKFWDLQTGRLTTLLKGIQEVSIQLQFLQMGSWV